MNVVQITALSIARSNQAKIESDIRKDTIDTWLMFAHPEDYKYNIKKREEQAQQKRDDVEITGDSMEEILSLVEGSEMLEMLGL